MGESVQQMLAGFREGVLDRQRHKLKEVRRMDDRVDVLESEILRYLGAIRARSLSEQESAEVALAMKAADGLESVGDVIETDLVDLGYRTLDEDIQTSEAMRYLFRELGDKLSSALDSTIRAVQIGRRSDATANSGGGVRQPADIKIPALLVYGSVFRVAPRVTYNSYAPLVAP